MKKVYFVQVGFGFDESVYLPYAVGTIIAYCNADAQIKKQYEFSDIIFRRERLNDAIAKIKNPYLVAFSCSVWNVEYNKALAKMIKEKYPDAVILFGGHSVSEDLKLIESEPYIDILMFGEGEESFCNLLKGFSDGEISRVNNIAYKNGGEIIKTPREFYDDISSYPSPYTSGVFNSLIKNNPGTDFLAVLETNRGCPYSCAYCDWCAGKKTRLFPMEKVLDEIRWLSENMISYCFCADSNFGMFERDYDIALALINAKKETGFPKVICTPKTGHPVMGVFS